MRIAIGLLGTVGLGVTVAVAQPPLSSIERPRVAALLPPIVPDSSDIPVLARGVADDLPTYPNSTPVMPQRPIQGLWANGIDPNVRTAGGVSSNQPAVSVVAPAVTTPDDPSALSRGLDKLKGAFNGNQSATNGEGREQPNASTPFRGATANGSVVYAGPPTWRWYGWGSVTPGANPYAPTGQYPKASANWYSITGATPGAFPVPVTNPVRTTPGTEPPTYVATSAPRSSAPTYYPQNVPMPVVSQPAYATQPQPTQPSALPSTTMAPPIAPQQPSSIPATINRPLAPELSAPTTNAPTSPTQLTLPTPSNSISTPIPQIAPPMVPSVVPLPLAPTNPQNSMQDLQPGNQAPLSVQPMVPLATVSTPISMLPVIPAASAQSNEQTIPETKLSVIESSAAGLPVSAPAALPFSAMEKELNWQPTNDPTPGAWLTPAKPRPATPPAAQPPVPAPSPSKDQPTQPGTTAPAPTKEQSQADEGDRNKIVARGQMGENTPDPVVMLIKRVCDGRAAEVDVRWTGSRRLSVCFECRGATEAQQLVKDISARPEFVPYRIDFCVLVK